MINREGGTLGGTLHYIGHTHWEGAVFKTREQYLDMGLANILRALRLLEADPDYRFTLDQSCYVAPFLDRYPEEVPAFKRFVAEGRLAIVGGTHVMHDGNIPGPESLVRQIEFARSFFRRELGLDVNTAWQLDTFGHHAQTPQVLKLAGFDTFWFFRGVPNWGTRAEFLWEALDGTRIPAYWLPHSYAMAYGSPATPAEFAEFMRGRYAMLGPFTDRPHRSAPAGADVCEPEPHVAEMARKMGEGADGQVRVVLSVPADYERAVPPSDDWPVLRAELNPIFQGAYSSRIELKQQLREIEGLLTDADALGAALGLLGIEGHGEPLWDAWEPALFNQAHDLMAGVMTDHVYEDTLASYAHARRLAQEAVEGRVGALVENVDTRCEGIPVVVVNTLVWARDDRVIVDVGFSADGVRGVRVIGPDGSEEPAQIVESARMSDGTLASARIAFVAHGVPALGYRVYRVLPALEPTEEPVWSDAGSATSIANDRMEITFDERGSIVGLKLRAGRELIAGRANVIAKETDRGDLWEPYRSLDGGSRIAMTDRHPILADAVLSADLPPEVFRVRRGPVVSEVHVEGPLGEGRYATTVCLTQGLGRADVRTMVHNSERFVRYRAVVPTSIADGTRTDEIPFGAMERPDGIEFPAQNWIDWSDGTRGLAVLNRGLPGANVADGAMLLSLMRSTCIVAYGFGGGYEPGMSSDTGFELGATRAFEYALVPHGGDWRRAEVHRRGVELNHPLLTRKAAPSPGALPPESGLLAELPPALMVTSIRRVSDRQVALRLYEATGEPLGDTAIELSDGIAEAWETDLLGESAVALPVRAGRAIVSFRPFEIKALRLRSADAVRG